MQCLLYLLFFAVLLPSLAGVSRTRPSHTKLLADFSGTYDNSNWSTRRANAWSSSQSGTLDTSGQPNSLRIVTGNNGDNAWGEIWWRTNNFVSQKTLFHIS